MSRNLRTDEDYAIDAVLRTLKVFDALEGTNFEAVTTQRIAQRTGFNYDFCMRALRTMKVAGWVTQNQRGEWMVGTKLLHYSERFNDLCIATLKHEAVHQGKPEAAQEFENFQTLNS
jgi:hypothetical protein